MINTHNLIIEFGKHKDKRWTRLPVGYLKWLVNERTQYANIANAELKRRGTVLEHEIEISGHAIDRASLSCRKIWHETSKKREGIHAWLYRIASEAIKVVDKSAMKDDYRLEVKNYNKMKLIFKFGKIYPILLTVMPYKK